MREHWFFCNLCFAHIITCHYPNLEKKIHMENFFWVLPSINWLNAVSNTFLFLPTKFGWTQLSNWVTFEALIAIFFSFLVSGLFINIYNMQKLYSFHFLQGIVLTIPTVNVKFFCCQTVPLLLKHLRNTQIFWMFSRSFICGSKQKLNWKYTTPSVLNTGTFLFWDFYYIKRESICRNAITTLWSYLITTNSSWNWTFTITKSTDNRSLKSTKPKKKETK